MMRRITNTTPPPTALPTPIPPPPPPPGAPGPRLRKPSSPEIFCCSFLRISSRSGGPSLFFFPHWGSFGGIWEYSKRRKQKWCRRHPSSSCGGESSRGVARCLGQHFPELVDARAGERTYL